MKVLFLYQGNTSDPSFRARTLPLFRELKKIDFKVIVIKDDLGVQSENLDIIIQKETNFPKYILDIFSRIKCEDFDLVHSLKPGTSFLSFLISRIKNKPLVLDVDDYDWTKNFIYKSAGSFLINHSNHESLITASRALTDWLDGEYLPNTASLKEFNKKKHKGERASIREKYNLKRCQVLLWAGIFVPQVNTEFLLKVGKNLRKNQRLLVIGGGRKFPQFKKQASNLKNNKIITTGWIEKTEMPKYYSVGDIGIFPFPDTWYHQCKCPIKLFEYMAAELPVFTTPVGEPAYMVKKTGCGEICENPADLTQKASNKGVEELKKTGAKGREYLEKKQNMKSQAKKVKNIYIDALEES